MKHPLPFFIAALVLGAGAARSSSAQTCTANDAAAPDVTALFETYLFNGPDSAPRLAVNLALAPAFSFRLGGLSLFFTYDAAALSFEKLTFAPFVTDNACYLPLGNNTDNGRTTAGLVISPGCNPTGGTGGTALAAGGAPVVIATATYRVRDAGARPAFVFTNAVSNDDAGGRCNTARMPLFGQDLPVELVHFSASADGAAALLAWTTAGETNNAGFAVEHRAPAATAWADAGWQPGAGTSATARDYAFRLENLAPGQHLFRLRQVDFDGAAHLSPSVSVEVTVAPAAALSPVVPQPVQGAGRFALTLERAASVTLDVVDVLGRVRARLHEGRLEGPARHDFTLDGAGLPAGVYFVRLRGAARVETRQFVVVR